MAKRITATTVDSRAPSVVVDGVSKAYGPAGTHVLALDRLSLEVEPGAFVCLVGASGCGKTTLLKPIAGLDRPSGGPVDVGGRRVALLFQDAALFPWLTAGANVELALRLRGFGRREREARAAELMTLVHQEVPYGLTVEVEHLGRNEQGQRLVHAVIWLERESHKKIVIGKAGSVLKQAGTLARHELNELLGERVLQRLGFEV